MTEAEENSGRNAAEAPETTSVLPIVAHTKAVPQLLGDARDQLAAAWAR